MLNITHNSINKKVTLQGFMSYGKAFHKKHFKLFNRFLLIFAVIIFVMMFLPWTQNVSGNGYVTTLTPGQRPQTIQSPIPGRIEKWFVREGDSVKKGDTILYISEIKNEYLDPKLVERTIAQRDAKSKSVSSYQEKIKALQNQISALKQERLLKLEQATNKLAQSQLKVQSDSIDLVAVTNNIQIAERQFNRIQTLNKEGLKSVTDVEAKRLKLQEMQAKLVSQKNKLLTSKNSLINSKVELSRINATYADKIAKIKSTLYSAESSKFDTEAQVNKLSSQSTNYQLRNNMYYIKAPQNGYLNKALKVGIGETFKAGEELVGVMPASYDLAVETYVSPIDLPLIHIGEEIRIQFDGWPAIFFSGWPNASFGTYGGKVVAIDRFISENGKFRILIAPDANPEHSWPKNVRVGSGAYTIALLNNVPIWYEIWRRLNGFPPDYYTPESGNKEEVKNKKKK